MANSDRINRVAFVLCICNWLFGMGVVQYPLGNRHPTISTIYSSICIISYCTISAIAYPHMIRWSIDLGDMAVSIKLLFYSNIILVVSVIVLARYRSEGTFNSLKKSMMVNDLIERMGCNSMQKKMRIAYVGKLVTSAILVIGFIVIHAVIIGINEMALIGKITAVVSLCYPVVIMFIADLTFVIRVSIISRKYMILNDTLKIIMRDEPDVPRHKCLVNELTHEDYNEKQIVDVVSHTVPDLTNVVKLTKQIHLQLLQLCEEVNDSYGWQILLSIVVAFGIITGNVYVTYMLLQEKHVKKLLAYTSIVNSTVWTLYYGVKISNFTRVCSRCQQNAIETGDILNKFYDDPFASDDVQSEIRDFNVQQIQRPLNFTAAGYISLDTSLMKTMVSTITTYLMIMVELGKGHT